MRQDRSAESIKVIEARVKPSTPLKLALKDSHLHGDDEYHREEPDHHKDNASSLPNAKPPAQDRMT
jgi:hypothetical protein